MNLGVLFNLLNEFMVSKLQLGPSIQDRILWSFSIEIRMILEINQKQGQGEMENYP